MTPGRFRSIRIRSGRREADLGFRLASEPKAAFAPPSGMGVRWTQAKSPEAARPVHCRRQPPVSETQVPPVTAMDLRIQRSIHQPKTTYRLNSAIMPYTQPQRAGTAGIYRTSGHGQVRAPRTGTRPNSVPIRGPRAMAGTSVPYGDGKNLDRETFVHSLEVFSSRGGGPLDELIR